MLNPQYKQYQEYGVDADGKVTHAGVVNAPRMSQRIAKRIQHKWQIWRVQYLSENPGDYPLRNTKPTKVLVIWPLFEKEKKQVFQI